MKKTRSLLALLLLGGMVLAGCGNKDKGGKSGDSNTPSQQGGESGDNGGEGQGGGGQQGGGEGQGGGGQQGGGEGQGGGGQQGGGEGGELPVNSQFVNKKFVFDSLSYPDNPTIAETLTANFQGAYAAFFDSGDFQLVSVINTYTMALLGTYTVHDNDSYARLDVRKEYDGQSEAYEHIESGSFVTNIRFNEGLQKYVLPMRQYVESLGTINFDIYLVLSNEAPEPADLPTDPNGDSFDPAYQVRKDVWDRLFVQRGLLHASSSNYKMTSGTTIFEVDDGEKFYLHYTTGSPNSGEFFERTAVNGSPYTYTDTIISGGEVYSSAPVDFQVDFFDQTVGLAPIPFNWMRYNAEGHYYHRSQYTYQNSFAGSITLYNYRVYFGSNYKLLKITYTDYAQQDFEFNFSEHHQIELSLDDLTNGGGGGGIDPQPVSWPTSKVNQYLSALGASDSLPPAQHSSVTAYEFDPANVANVTDSFTITCVGGAALASSYEGLLEFTHGFTYDGGNDFFISPNEEFCVHSYASSGNYIIDIGAYNGGGDPTPTLDPSYQTAMNSFETATGISVPVVYNLGAEFVDRTDNCSFYTYDGATSDTLNTFVTYYNTLLSSWDHVGPETSGSETRHTYTNSSGDELKISFYNYGENNSYIVVTYTPAPAAESYIHYGTGEDWYDQPMYASGSNIAQYENLYMLKNDEFAICIEGNTWLHYEDYVHDPDTAGGMITQGEETVGGHNFHVGETGQYSIYVNSENKVYIVHETSGGGGGDPVVTWPGEYIEDALTTWGIQNDIVPECDLTGVTSAFVYPETSVSADDEVFIIGVIGGNKGNSYAGRLAEAGYGCVNGYFVTSDAEISIMLSEDGDNITIAVYKGDLSGVVMPEFPCISILSSSGVRNETLSHDSEANQYFIEGLSLEAGDQFVICIDNSTYKFFEDFVIGDPDTANGKVIAGMETDPGYHAFAVTEDGEYDIYINSVGEVYIVHGPQVPNVPYMQYGSDLEGWKFEELSQSGSQWQIEEYYLYAGTEVVFNVYDTWYHYNDYVSNEYSAGKISGEGPSNLIIEEDGYYSFYINEGHIYVVYTAE